MTLAALAVASLATVLIFVFPALALPLVLPAPLLLAVVEILGVLRRRAARRARTAEPHVETPEPTAEKTAGR